MVYEPIGGKLYTLEGSLIRNHVEPFCISLQTLADVIHTRFIISFTRSWGMVQRTCLNRWGVEQVV